MKCYLKRMIGNRLSARTLFRHPFVDVGELSNDNDNDSQEHGFEEDEQVEDMGDWRLNWERALS